MKKSLIAIIIFLTPIFLAPVIVSAHGEENESMPMMNSGEEESVTVSQEEFNEVEDIMLKMMNREELTESEAQEMYSFMQSHHAIGWPMMMGYGDTHDSFNRSHMYGGFGMTMNWLYSLMVLVWLGVGVLLVIWLWRRLSLFNEDK